MNRKQRRANSNGGPQPPGNPAIMTIFNEALGHHQAGRLNDAQLLYRQILTIDPNHAHSLHMMAVIGHDAGQPAIAEDLARRALASRNDVGAFYNTLGNALKAQGRLEEALENYNRALALKADLFDALNNMATTLIALGRKEEAPPFFERALAIKPGHPGVLNNLGHVLLALGQYKDATQCYLRAADIQPDGVAYLNVGISYQSAGALDKAIDYYQRALALMPDNPVIFNNIGIVLNELRRFEEAIEYYRKALALGDEKAETLSNLAASLKNLGRLDEAMVYYRRALAKAPDHAMIYSNLLFCMVYSANVTPEELAETARGFGETIADPLLRTRALKNDKTPGRKLRIGYCSPDFRAHPVDYFFSVLLNFHDRSQFEIYAYSNTLLEDDITQRVKGEVDHWRDIRSLNDDAAADLIEADKIDIFIDLAGHTGHNRLPVFARKPAPVQVTWLGYPATTGMKAMDYRITDIYGDPEGLTEKLNTETLWRLPEIFCCYRASGKNPAVIDHPPFEDNGFITFGCFNNFSKVTDPVLEAWAKIMAAVPGSRLLLEIAGLDDEKFRADTKARMEKLGLPMERIILEPRRRENQFVLYNKIDIALDPFPCVGGTTSMDCIWMGAPFVTLAGKSFVSRMGVTILTNVGLPELIAKDVDAYVKIAADLAKDTAWLKAMRRNLRQRVEASPVMDQQAFARNMEEAYRRMWQTYCAGTRP